MNRGGTISYEGFLCFSYSTNISEGMFCQTNLDRTERLCVIKFNTV